MLGVSGGGGVDVSGGDGLGFSGGDGLGASAGCGLSTVGGVAFTATLFCCGPTISIGAPVESTLAPIDGEVAE